MSIVGASRGQREALRVTRQLEKASDEAGRLCARLLRALPPEGHGTGPERELHAAAARYIADRERRAAEARQIG